MSIDLRAFADVLEDLKIPVQMNHLLDKTGGAPAGEYTAALLPRNHIAWNVFTNLSVHDLVRVEELLTGQ